MSVATVDTTSQSASAAASAATSSSSTSALGENDFLNLLVTEMQNQDPDNPMDDTQFISELAQFSSLQAATNMGTDQQNTQAVSMIGATVTYPDPTDTTGATSLTGTVTGASFTNSGPSLSVVDSTGTVNQVTLSSVTSVQ